MIYLALFFWLLAGIGTYLGMSWAEDKHSFAIFIACILIWPVIFTSEVIAGVILFNRESQ